ncbi:DNA repair protein RecN [candidate division WOR-3 bacterium]|nr:DNA repair protein RecN [candidate division WOR-3 bacterium]
MIREMRVRNYALLNNICITFDEGFNVLTGSTGTGKSILINALSLLLGEKGDIGSIRRKEDRAVVEGIFTPTDRVNKILRNAGISEDDELIIRRIVNRKGGGGVYINDSIANLKVLKEVSKVLFDIHGQHEHQLLLNEETHIDFLDAFGKLLKDREEVAALFRQINLLASELNKKVKDRDNIAERKELYEFQKKELESAKFSSEEYKELKEEKKMLDNFEEISLIVDSAIAKIDKSEDAILNNLSEIGEDLKKVSSFDKKLASISERMNESHLILQDAILDLSRYHDSLEYDRERLNELEEIIDRIEYLKKKHNRDYSGLIQLKKEMEDKIFDLDSLSREIEALKEDIEKGKVELSQLSRKLSEKRKEISSGFEKMVLKELQDLGFENAGFGVKFEEKNIDEKGGDSVQFLFEPNVGEGMNPLSKIASGGELSRVMLALKSILSEVDKVEGIVFDEIDTGIGGSLGKKIGEKMQKIGEKRQVLCVTHLPNIASNADFHIKVDKETKEGRTITIIHPVEGEERIDEIARMLSGDKLSKTAIKHARELLEEV